MIVFLDKHRIEIWSGAISFIWFNIGRYWGDDMVAWLEGIIS